MKKIDEYIRFGVDEEEAGDDLGDNRNWRQERKPRIQAMDPEIDIFYHHDWKVEWQ